MQVRVSFEGILGGFVCVCWYLMCVADCCWLQSLHCLQVKLLLFQPPFSFMEYVLHTKLYTPYICIYIFLIDSLTAFINY